MATDLENKIIQVVALAMQSMEDGSYLLARRGPKESGAGHWEFPGGKIEPGETQIQALVREIKEELSYDVLPESLQFVGENLHKYPARDIVIYLWKLRVVQRPKFQLVDHDLTAWYQVPELAEIDLSPGDKAFISLLN